MFIQYIEEPEQQKVFLALARAVMKADGKLDTREEALLAELDRQTAGIHAADCEEYDLETLPQLFPDTRSRVSLVLELLGMALVNDDYTPEQKTLVYDVADRLSISVDKLEEMEGWTATQFNLLKQAEAFMQN